MTQFQSRPMPQKKCFLFATASLLAGLAMGQSADRRLIESLRELAASRVRLDLCLASPDFRKLADGTQRQFIAASNRLDRLSNDLHESPKGRLLFVSYHLAVSKFRVATGSGKQLGSRQGGACDFSFVTDAESNLKTAMRHLSAR